MRKPLFTSLALGCGAVLGLVSLAAEAIPIHPNIVDLSGAAGGATWTSDPIGDPHGTVSLSGWEFDNGAWTPAIMSYKSGSAAETGLGVFCNQTPAGNACGEDEIGSTPWQMIDMDISQFTNWYSLTINLGSINGDNQGDETGYLVGASCQLGGTCTSSMLANPNILGSCTDYGQAGNQTCTFNFTESDLSGITDIWITPSLTNQGGRSDGNILLGGDMTLYTPVPEPATWGMFGLGALLIGLFAALRRREAD